MARKYVNPNRGSGLPPDWVTNQIRTPADLRALMASDPGPWMLIKTADLEQLLEAPAKGAPLSEAQILALFTDELRK